LVHFRTVSVLVILADRQVLSTQVPVDIDSTHAILPVRSSNGHVINKHASVVSLGDVGSGLRTDVSHGIHNAVDIRQIRLLAGANIFSVSDHRRKIIWNVLGRGSTTNLDRTRTAGSRIAVDNDGG
jgi:hypothetical protein